MRACASQASKAAMRGPAPRCRRADILIIGLRKEVSKQGLDVIAENIAGSFGLGRAYGVPARVDTALCFADRRTGGFKLAAKDPPFNSH